MHSYTITDHMTNLLKQLGTKMLIHSSRFAMIFDRKPFMVKSSRKGVFFEIFYVRLLNYNGYIQVCQITLPFEL